MTNELQNSRIQEVISLIENNAGFVCQSKTVVQVAEDTGSLLIEFNFNNHRGLIWVRKSGLVRTVNGKTVIKAKGGFVKTNRPKLSDIVKPKMLGSI